MAFLDFIFPKRCVSCRKFGDYICANCFAYISFTESGTCFVCQRSSYNFLTHPKCNSRFSIDGVFSSLLYKGVVKRLIYKFKYDPYLKDLQKAMIDLFYEGLVSSEYLYKLLHQKSILVPIPLHNKKHIKRGYNQSEILARGLGKKFGIPIANALLRVKNTIPQVSLNQKEREDNIKNAFKIRSQSYELRLKSCDNILLVDDVVTSGSTLKEASKVLKKAGAKNVYGLTLAHGQ